MPPLSVLIRMLGSVEHSTPASSTTCGFNSTITLLANIVPVTRPILQMHGSNGSPSPRRRCSLGFQRRRRRLEVAIFRRTISFRRFFRSSRARASMEGSCCGPSTMTISLGIVQKLKTMCDFETYM